MNTDDLTPEISRLFIGARMEFEVETVFAKEGSVSPDEAHEYDEILVLLDGSVELRLDDRIIPIKGLSMYEIPAGTRHIIRAKETPTRLVIIHPDRLGK